MRRITIHRCPLSNDIRSHAEQLRAALEATNPNVKVRIVDGVKREFSVVDHDRTIFGMDGSLLRSVEELAAQVRKFDGLDAG